MHRPAAQHEQQEKFYDPLKGNKIILYEVPKNFLLFNG